MLTAHDLTHAWLADCANALAQDPARLAHPERWLWGPEAPVSRLRLPLLLVSEGTEGTGELRGHRAWLTLALMPAPGAGLTLAPLPASALLPVDTHWAAVMSELQAGVQGLLSPEGAAAASSPWQDWAIGWDVAPQSGEPALASLEGRSAAASLTLGVLWLVRRWLNPSFSASPLWPLACLSQAELERCWVSADVRWPAGQPVLAPVDDRGLVAKAAALARYDDTVLLHTCQAVEGPRARHVKPAADWDGLLAGMGAELGWTPAQAQLLWALQAQDPEVVANQGLGQPELPPSDALLAVAQEEHRALTPLQAALCLFARWEHQEQGPVMGWHVPLGLDLTDTPAHLVKSLADEREALREQAARVAGHRPKSPAEGPAEAANPATPDPYRLDELLRSKKVTRDALVLVGEPGAGKTTLMRHLVQTRCWQAVRAWGQGQRPAELALYLPLHALSEHAEPVDWARRELRAQGLGAWVEWALPDPPAEEQEPGQAEGLAVVPPAWLPQAWRWVADGLNELPYGPTQTRAQRAEQVLAALQEALVQPPQPPGAARVLPLLSLRSQHEVMSDAWLRVQVLRWGEPQMQAYLHKRFGPEQGQVHLAQLRQQPQALELAATPLMLAGLADLLSEGWAGGRLPTNRARLYAAWLWLRLRRLLGHYERRRQAQPADRDALSSALDSLLRPQDQRLIADAKHWKGETTGLQLPLHSPLLAALVAQAEAQYWQDHAQGKGSAQRCDVAVPWQDDAHPAAVSRTLANHAGLEPAQWLQAVQAMGLAQCDAAGLFKFSHPSWGEYLASLRLLATPPEQLERQCQAGEAQALRQWQRISQHCAPPPVPDPAALLTDQRQTLSQRWEDALPEESRAELLAQGLRIPWAEWLAFAGEPGTKAYEDRFKEYFDPAFGPILHVVDDAQGQRWMQADLMSWGQAVGLQDSYERSLGSPPGAWHETALGWGDLIRLRLFKPFEAAAWDWLKKGLSEPPGQALQQDGGHLGPPPVGDCQEVLTLALLGLPDPAPWLARLLAGPHWRAAVPAALALREPLEPRAPGAGPGPWEAGHWHKPHPALQFLRRRLLLDCLHAGPQVAQRLNAAGLLGLLLSPASAEPTGLGARLKRWVAGMRQRAQPAWQRSLEEAWATAWQEAQARPQGVPLQQRIQSAEWLGLLGDNLRYQRAQHPAQAANAPPQPNQPGRPVQPQRGLLLRPPHWVAVGAWGQAQRYRMGTRDIKTAGDALEAVLPLKGFVLPIYPATVGEFACFVESGGYDPQQTWWQGAGRAWLLSWQQSHPGAQRRPFMWGEPGYNNPLLPVVGLTCWEAQAFTRWAQALRPCAEPGQPPAAHPAPHPLQQPDRGLSLPSELHLQAAARGPSGQEGSRRGDWPFDPQALPPHVPGALAFNHDATRLGRLAPVGVFTLALSPSGVEQCGNAYTWCRNLSVEAYDSPAAQAMALNPAPDTDTDSVRALVGGSFNSTADVARVAFRYRNHPGSGRDYLGVRWVLSPHSDC